MEPRFESFYPPWVAGIDLPQSRHCGFFVSFIDKEHILTYKHRDNQRVTFHDHIFKWKHFPRYWPSVRGIHRWPVNSPHKGQWRRALMFSFICAWINGWENNREPGDLRRHHAYYNVTVICPTILIQIKKWRGIACVLMAQRMFCGSK